MVLPPVEQVNFTKDFPRLKICVAGAGGFIASHLAKRLKEEGHFVRAVDWKENEYMEVSTFCDEFLNLDLRYPDACKTACEGMEWCFNLAVRPLPPAGCPQARARCRPASLSMASARRPTWAAWASSSPTIRASSTTRP